MARTFQNVGLIRGITVRTNVLAAEHLAARYSAPAGLLGLPGTYADEHRLSQRAEALRTIRESLVPGDGTVHLEPADIERACEGVTDLRDTESVTFRAQFARGALPRSSVHWVEPKLVGQVAFTEWTGAGQLRHPRYLGLRRDKDPASVTREVARP